ncbi:MAG: hypothetical protein E7334_04585 [Clostridiales bacterium]|nr:hypothetical protein [Clostridiales bacterium]
MKEYISYEMFGAIGDGVHDDMPAIKKAHEEAGKLGLPVKAKPGAVYYISPKAVTACITTDTIWEGAKFIIDDRGCEDIKVPVFKVISTLSPVDLPLKKLAKGQTKIENITNRDLYVAVKNDNHMDYIRFGLNQDNGSERTDAFTVNKDGVLCSPVSFDFDEITYIFAAPIDEKKLFISGGEFVTIANECESKYTYHSRNIEIMRSNADIGHISHFVENEKDHGAPYRGFISVSMCANVTIHDILFTAHKIYYTIGSAGLPVMMGSYDINVAAAVNISFINCTQTTDIHDNRYWGLIGSNYCRDLYFENCRISRFDAHKGVSGCTIKNCTLGWQGLNAIGHGLFTIEDTAIYGPAVVYLRHDYGGHWDGDIVIRNCSWQPSKEKLELWKKEPRRRALFDANNDGHHDFGFKCRFPKNILIDSLSVLDDSSDPLYVFTDYLGDNPAPESERKYLPEEPEKIVIKNLAVKSDIMLCSNMDLFKNTEFICE